LTAFNLERPYRSRDIGIAGSSSIKVHKVIHGSKVKHARHFARRHGTGLGRSHYRRRMVRDGAIDFRKMVAH